MAGKEGLGEEAHLVAAGIEPARRIAEDDLENDQNAQQQRERQHRTCGAFVGGGLGTAFHLDSGKSLTCCVG